MKGALALLRVVAVATAICVFGLLLVPSSVWTKPAVDDVYRGFDPSFLYIDPKGDGNSVGIITATDGSMQIEATPFSDPTVQLTTSPLSFSAAFRFRVLSAQGLATPLRVCLSNPV